MKINEKQLVILFELAMWFSQLNMNWRHFGPPFTQKTINELVNEIINQQSRELIEIK